MSSRVPKRFIQGIQFFLFAGFILIILLLMGPFRQVVLREAENIKNNLILRLEEEGDLEISYQSMGSFFFSAMEIRDIEVKFQGGTFQGRRVRIYLNFFKLLKKRQEKDPLSFISRVVISDVNMNIVLGDPEEPSEEAPLDFWPLLAEKTLIIQNLELDLQAPQGHHLETLVHNLSLKNFDDRVRFELDTNITAHLTGELAFLGESQVALTGKGSFSPYEAAFNGRFDVEEISSFVISLLPQAFDLSFAEDTLEIHRLGDQIPLDMAFATNFKEKTWNMAFDADQLRVGDLILPGRGYENLSPWFAAEITGRGSIRQTAKGLDYDAAIQTNLPSGPLPWDLSADIAVAGDENQSRWEHLELSTPWGYTRYQGLVDLPSFTPSGSLLIEIDQELLGYPVGVELEMKKEEGMVVIEPVDLLSGPQVFEDFQIILINDANNITASLMAVPASLPGKEISSSLFLDLFLETGKTPSLKSFLNLQGVPAYSLLRFTGWEPEGVMAESLQDFFLDAEGTFELAGGDWVSSLHRGVLRSGKNPENKVEIVGRARPGQAFLDNIELSWDNLKVNGHLSHSFDEENWETFLRLSREEDVYDFQIVKNEKGILELTGPYGLEGSLLPPSPFGRFYSLKTEDFQVPLSPGILSLGLDLRGHLSPEGGEHFLSDLSLALTGRAGWPDPRFQGKGTFREGVLEMPSITYTDRISTLEGSAKFEQLSPQDTLGWLTLGDALGEQYDFTITQNNQDFTASLGFSQSPLKRWNEEKFLGSVQARLDLTFEKGEPRLLGRFSSQEASYEGRPLEFGSRISLEDRRLRVNELTFSQDNLSLTRGLIFANLEKGSLRAAAALGAEYNDINISSGASLAVDIHQELNLLAVPRWQDLEITATLALQPFLWDGALHLPGMTFHGKSDPSGISVIHTDKNVLDARFLPSTGELSVVSNSPLPVTSRISGIIGEEQIDLNLQNLSVDPVLINYVMPRDPILKQYHVVFQDGEFTGDLRITGQKNDPEFHGMLKARNLQVDTPYTNALIGRGNTTINFEGGIINIAPFDVKVGNGYIAAEGTISMDRWSITETSFLFGARGSTGFPGVPVAYPLLGINLNGLFTGIMTLVSDDRSIRLKGQFVFPELNASLGDSVEILEKKNDSSSYPLPISLDFDIVTGTQCTFFLPNEEFTVVRATAAPDQTLNLKYVTDPESFSLTGTIPIQRGDIFYFDRNFQVIEGEIVFNESLELFNPNITFRAETRVRDEEGEEVTVALTYDAPVMDEFNPAIETIPPRSELEILTLFGQAVLPYSELGQADVSTVILATGGIFSQMGIVQPFEKALRDVLKLDMVTLRTDIIEKALEEGLVREESYRSDISSSSLGRYLDNTSLSLGKYFGNSLFLSGSVTANYLEGQRLVSVFGGLEFETRFSLEMQTPFFAVGWSYQPDPTVSNNFLAVEDQNITLKWKFSY